MGGGITNLVVAAGGVTQFTRVINLGAESAHPGAHAAPRGLVRRGRGAAHPGGARRRAARSARRPHARDPGRRSTSTFEQACEPFSDELRRSIDYYHTQEHVGRDLQAGRSRGDGALTRNIAYCLSQGLHLPVEIGNPLREVGENKTKLTEVQLEWMAPRLAIAIGLALDDEG